MANDGAEGADALCTEGRAMNAKSRNQAENPDRDESLFAAIEDGIPCGAVDGRMSDVYGDQVLGVRRLSMYYYSSRSGRDSLFTAGDALAFGYGVTYSSACLPSSPSPYDRESSDAIRRMTLLVGGCEIVDALLASGSGSADQMVA